MWLQVAICCDDGGNDGDAPRLCALPIRTRTRARAPACAACARAALLPPSALFHAPFAVARVTRGVRQPARDLIDKNRAARGDGGAGACEF